MQAPLASADRRSAVRQSASRSLREGASLRAPQPPPLASASCARFRGGPWRETRTGGRSYEPSVSEAYQYARAVAKASAIPSARARGGRGRVRETPQTCPGPPEWQRSPARGSQGRGAPVKGAPGHLRRSWCPEAAISGGKAPRGAAGGGKAAPASAFHRPNCASGSEHEGRRGVQGSGKWNIPCFAQRRTAKQLDNGHREEVIRLSAVADVARFDLSRAPREGRKGLKPLPGVSMNRV